MKLYCSKCDREVDVIAVPSGPHIKAICPNGHYLKFLNPEEKKQLEVEEDELE